MSLKPRDAFRLYGAVMSVIFAFFAFGLLIGKNYLVEARPALHSAGDEPVSDLKQELDFYQRVMEPAGKEQAASEPVDPAPAAEGPERPEPEESGSPVYTVQVGALSSEHEASQMLLRLEAKGHHGELRQPSGSDPYFRVWVGRFRDRQLARIQENELKADGFLTYLKSVESNP